MTNESGYYIELYWPDKKPLPFHEEYWLWAHDDKVDRVNSIPTGSRILFYETEKDDKGNAWGSKTIFAAGELTDRVPEDAEPSEDARGRIWRAARTVEIDLWISSPKGVPLSSLRRLLRHSDRWNMRQGPYEISKEDYEAVVQALGRRPGCKGARKGPSKHPQPEFPKVKFKGIKQKEEDESVRQQAADRIRIGKVHNKLINAFSKYCRTVLRFEPEEGVFDALIRFPGTDNSLLIEAKSAVAGGQGKHQVRQAIGQLFDYRFTHWPNGTSGVSLAVLFPEKPLQQTIQLLHSLRIGAIWRYGERFVASRVVRDAHPTLQRFESAES